jgi:hypothetical protein
MRPSWILRMKSEYLHDERQRDEIQAVEELFLPSLLALPQAPSLGSRLHHGRIYACRMLVHLFSVSVVT